MQIYIVGSHGAGKTTLAKLISKKFGLRYVRELARDILDYKNWTWKEMKPVDYYMFECALALYNSEKRFMNNFVSDRSIIDVSAYITYYLNKHKEEIIKSDIYEEFVELQQFTFKRCNHDLRDNTIYIYATSINAGDESSIFVSNFVERRLKILGIEEYKSYSYSQTPPLYITYFKPNTDDLEKGLEKSKEFIDNILVPVIQKINLRENLNNSGHCGKCFKNFE